MKRIHVYYDGIRYSVSGREVADLKAEIEGALADGAPYWLKVNHGEGTLRETELLVGPGIGIAVMPIDPDAEEPLPAAAVALPTEGV